MVLRGVLRVSPVPAAVSAPFSILTASSDGTITATGTGGTIRSGLRLPLLFSLPSATPHAQLQHHGGQRVLVVLQPLPSTPTTQQPLLRSSPTPPPCVATPAKAALAILRPPAVVPVAARPLQGVQDLIRLLALHREKNIIDERLRVRSTALLLAAGLFSLFFRNLTHNTSHCENTL